MIHLLNKEKYSKLQDFTLFLCKSAKLFMSFSKLMFKSRSTDKTHKSISQLSDIVLRVVVFISFILLNILSYVVDETGLVIAAMIRDIIVRNLCFSVHSS
jgi:hypothetical protein